MNTDLLFDSLADPTRRRILALLVAQGELCVCELTSAVDDIQPKISRHLGVLKEAGIVVARREGPWMFYRPVANLPAWAATILAALRRPGGGMTCGHGAYKTLRMTYGGRRCCRL